MGYLITVVVPVYNVKSYLGKCMESLLRQTCDENMMEILLIDDGSQDGSGKICDDYAQKYTNIKALHKQNGGLSSARNLGIDSAEGQYILFVDSDDFIEEATIEILQTSLQRYEWPDVVVFDGIEENMKDTKTLRGKTSLTGCCVQGKRYLLEHYQDGKLNVEAWLYLYRKGFLDKEHLRFREGILHEDVEFTPRALLVAERVAEISDRLYHYVIRENSISTNKDKRKNIRDLLQTLKELDCLAEEQDKELCRWMKNAILNSYLNIIYDARMYRKEYREFLDVDFLRRKAATPYNCMRVRLCIINVRLYCAINDSYKILKRLGGTKKCG